MMVSVYLIYDVFSKCAKLGVFCKRCSLFTSIERYIVGIECIVMTIYEGLLSADVISRK